MWSLEKINIVNITWHCTMFTCKHSFATHIHWHVKSHQYFNINPVNFFFKWNATLCILILLYIYEIYTLYKWLVFLEMTLSSFGKYNLLLSVSAELKIIVILKGLVKLGYMQWFVDEIKPWPFSINFFLLFGKCLFLFIIK